MCCTLVPRTSLSLNFREREEIEREVKGNEVKSKLINNKITNLGNKYYRNLSYILLDAEPIQKYGIVVKCGLW